MPRLVQLDEDLDARVAEIARARELSPDQVVREAVSEFVARADAHEAFGREAVASWEAYLATGRHLTSEEVFDWLRTWGTDRETGIPECHD